MDPGDKLQAILDNVPDYVRLISAAQKNKEGEVDDLGQPVPEEICVVLAFGRKGFGFGEITMVQTAAGLFIDSEHMGRERVAFFLLKLIESAITDVDRDPDAHKLYRRVMGAD